jgi:hypothetical protein
LLKANPLLLRFINSKGLGHGRTTKSLSMWQVIQFAERIKRTPAQLQGRATEGTAAVIRFGRAGALITQTAGRAGAAS